MANVAEFLCRRCWWREGGACYNEGLMGPGKVNKMPRKVHGDDRNGMEITDELWRACKVTSKAMPNPTPEPIVGGWQEDAIKDVETLFAEMNTAVKTCERCQGNGEIVTDWERYRHSHEDDVGDEAVAECPNCNGEGSIDA